MTNRSQKPPRWASKFLFRISKLEDRYSLLDDLEIEYAGLAAAKGGFRAEVWYIAQVFKAIPGILISSIIWRLTMYKNYFKIALRNLKRQKAYSFINITGLAVGMSCCIMISLWILDELNYDSYHENAENLYQGVKSFQGNIVTATPVVFAPALVEEFPEVAEASRFHYAEQVLITHQNDPFNENNAYFVDPAFLTMFTFDFIYGDKNAALNDPRSIVLTRSIAEKYFGEDDPMGKILTFNNEYDMVVTAVIENVPGNSMVQFDILLPYGLRLELNVIEGYVPSWGHNSPLTYIQLRDGSSGDVMKAKLENYLGSKIRAAFPQMTEKMTDSQLPQITITPLLGVRFEPVYRGSSRIQTLSLFAAIAFVILMIASINFMNLSTARSSRRAKEIGLRKVSGAGRKSVILQFLGESLLLSFLALAAAVVLTVISLPAFNDLFGRALSLNILRNSYVPLLLVGIALFTGLAGGSYPAFFLSRFQPVNTLKGDLNTGSRSAVLRKILVVFQFVLSISLIIGTGVIYKQLDFIKDKDIGYDTKNVVVITLNSGSRQHYQAIRNRLETEPNVVNISGLQDRPSYIGSSSSYAEWEGKDPNDSPTIGNFRTDYDLIKTMNIELIQGRDFSREFPTDIRNRFIVNEEMVRIMGMDNVIGKRLMYSGDEGTIIGVVKDFHYMPLRAPMRPLVIRLIPEEVQSILVRIKPENISDTVESLRNKWKEVVPAFPFEYYFLEDDFEWMYTSERRTADIFRSFSFIAIVIACLGIFGLASYTAEQRTKECGVRKVLGASNSSIMNMLSREFIILVLLSNIAAYPLSYYVMSSWLQLFAYRTNIGILVLAGASVIALIVTAVTVGLQAYKAARANPVDSLRYE